MGALALGLALVLHLEPASSIHEGEENVFEI